MNMHRNQKPIFWLILAVILMLNTSCASSQFQGLEPAPWHSNDTFREIGSTTHSKQATKPAQQVVAAERLKKGEYRVRRGDSLYSIALIHELDYKRLAAANRIPHPYVIYPNQIIKLREAKPVANVAVKPTVATQSAKPKPVESQKTVSYPKQVSAPSSGGIKWYWPINGNIVRTFGSGKVPIKGVDIKIEKVQSVLAAADGEVVFTGQGIGYGTLVIIKHSDNLLSAYANTQNIVVQEKQMVKAGQVLADLVVKDGQRVLHFEIRNQGKPEDPLRYLPKK